MVSFTSSALSEILPVVLVFEIEANKELIWPQRFVSNQMKLDLCSIVEVFDYRTFDW